MKKVTYAAYLFLGAVIMSCSQDGGYTKSDFGFEYKLINHDEGARKIENGNIVMYHVDYATDNAILMSTQDKNGGQPLSFRYTETMDQDSIPMLMAIKMLNLGDSAVFKFNAEDLFSKSFNTPRPDSISAESNIFAHLKLENVYTMEEYQAFMEGEEVKVFDEQVKEIDELLDAEGVEYQTTESGLRYVILEEGAGENPNQGDTVSVHYTGTLLDGTEFDSSLDRGEPFKFQLGIGQVITGWDEGISLLSKNTKAKFYIPSRLGYGARGSGGVIPPNSALIFEVELVDFK